MAHVGLDDGGPASERPDLIRHGAGRPILALGAEDDPYGTEAALDRLLRYYSASRRSHLRLSPGDVGQDSIGHFAFFHERFRDTLWPYALAWLRHAALPEGAAGRPKTLPAEH